MRVSSSLAVVSLALLFHLSCSKSEAGRKPIAAGVPEDQNRDYIAEAKVAKISLAKTSEFNAELPGNNLASALNGQWTNQFAWPIIPAHVVLLPNGKVFNYGTTGDGTQGAGFNYDVWDPALGTDADSHQWLPNETRTDIFCGGVSILPETGDVLVPGGDTRIPVNTGIKNTNLFNTGDNSLNRIQDMQFARWYPTTITLPNGETIIRGGRDGGNAPVSIPEIYNINEGWRTLWGAANGDITSDEEGRWFYPRDFIAPNGRIFGMSGNRMYWIDWQGQGAAEVLAQRLPNKSRSHVSTAVMYRPGQILQVGGSTNGDTQAEGSNQAITVDIRSGNPIVEDAPNMAKRRVWANSTVLPNGEVLITGGSAFENKLNDPATVAEIWNPDTRQFRQVATAATPRLYHSVGLLLPDATVLIAGGGAPGPLNNLNGEIYYPPYLFDGNGNLAPRLTIGEIANQFQYNNAVNVPYFGTGQVRRVTLVRNGAVTHSFDVGQRFLELDFTQQNGSVEAQMPNSPNIAPPGYYMLYLINEAGVPSLSKIISLNNIRGVAQPPVQPPVQTVDGLTVGDMYQVHAKTTDKCLDVAAASMENEAPIQQYECNNTQAQNFRLIRNQTGGLSLQNTNSNKCLDIEDLNQANGSLVQQWECNGGANQSLNFTEQDDGNYTISFAHSNKCLDLPEGNAANGTRPQQWDCTGNDFQRWNLTK